MLHTTQEVGAPVGVDFMSIRSPGRAKSTNVISISYDDMKRKMVKNYILDDGVVTMNYRIKMTCMKILKFSKGYLVNWYAILVAFSPNQEYLRYIV